MVFISLGSLGWRCSLGLAVAEDFPILKKESQFPTGDFFALVEPFFLHLPATVFSYYSSFCLMIKKYHNSKSRTNWQTSQKGSLWRCGTCPAGRQAPLPHRYTCCQETRERWAGLESGPGLPPKKATWWMESSPVVTWVELKWCGLWIQVRVMSSFKILISRVSSKNQFWWKENYWGSFLTCAVADQSAEFGTEQNINVIKDELHNNRLNTHFHESRGAAETRRLNLFRPATFLRDRYIDRYFAIKYIFTD